MKINLNFKFNPKRYFIESDFVISRRVIFVGIINTIVGPLVLLICDYFYGNIVKSYFLMQFFMFFFKSFMYKKIVFKEIKSKKSYILPIILVAWGLVLANFIQNLDIIQLYKLIVLLFLLTTSNALIALFGARFLKMKDYL